MRKWMALMLLLASSLVTPAETQVTNIKLNGPLVPGGDVGDLRIGGGFLISPDSRGVVYRVDQDTDNVFELFSVPLSGGIPTKLNGLLVPGGAVNSGFQISPDSRWVVYRADQDTDNVFELFSVPLSGGTPTKLNGLLIPGGAVLTLEISPNSSRVVYLADQDTDQVFELFSVPLSGGTSMKLNGPLVPGGDVSTFRISPDSSRVVYRADQDTDEVFELFTLTPAQVTQNLIDDMGSLVAAGTLTADQGSGLIDKLEAAQASLNRGNTRAACNQLRAFINQVNAFIHNGTLTPAEGQALLDVATDLRTELSC